MGSFWNKYDLLNSRFREDPNPEENSALWTLQLYLMKRKRGGNDLALPLYFPLRSYAEARKQSNGFYANMLDPDPNNENLKYISPDQLNELGIFSKLNNLNIHKEIWATMKKNFFTYDNVKGGFSLRRPVHPRDVLFFGIINESPICRLLTPLYFCFGVWTFFSHAKTRPKLLDRIKAWRETGEWPKTREIIKTDWEIIEWCRNFVIKDSVFKRFFYRIFDKQIVKRFEKGWHGVYETYYLEQNHPIRLEIELHKDLKLLS